MFYAPAQVKVLEEASGQKKDGRTPGPVWGKDLGRYCLIGPKCPIGKRNMFWSHMGMMEQYCEDTSFY